MDELVRWLGVQLAEDERIARAAEGDPVFDGTGIVVERNRARGFPDRIAGLISPVATHIAVHDPARVLREITAKRAVIADYEKAIRMRDELVPNTSRYRHWDNRSFGLYVALRYMVAVYADRPGYAEALAAEKAALLADE